MYCLSSKHRDSRLYSKMFAFSTLIKTQDKSKWSCPGAQLINKSQLTGPLVSFLIFMQQGFFSEYMFFLVA